MTKNTKLNYGEAAAALGALLGEKIEELLGELGIHIDFEWSGGFIDGVAKETVDAAFTFLDEVEDGDDA